MPLFSRRRQPDPPDPALPFLTEPQARELRGLVRSAFATRGLEVTVRADHVEDAAGRQYGLWNVAASCHDDERGRAAWPAVVDRHVQAVLAAMDAPDPFETMSDDELLASTYVRLYEAAGIPEPDRYPHVEFAPGLLAMLALDLPETVALMPRDVVTRLGGWQSAQERGLGNLRRERVDQQEVLQAPGGATFSVVLGESVYTASLALLLPERLREWGAPEPGPHGWLLSVPNRHQVVWHVLQDDSALAALHGMAVFARLGFEDSPGPLSPHVYWWSGTEYRQLTFDDEDGGRSIRVDAEFQAVLEALVPREP